MLRQEGVVAAGQNVDNGIADRDNVKRGGRSHAGSCER
jgi:hypothetical protein